MTGDLTYKSSSISRNNQYDPKTSFYQIKNMKKKIDNCCSIDYIGDEKLITLENQEAFNYLMMLVSNYIFDDISKRKFLRDVSDATSTRILAFASSVFGAEISQERIAGMMLTKLNAVTNQSVSDMMFSRKSVSPKLENHLIDLIYKNEQYLRKTGDHDELIIDETINDFVYATESRKFDSFLSL